MSKVANQIVKFALLALCSRLRLTSTASIPDGSVFLIAWCRYFAQLAQNAGEAKIPPRGNLNQTKQI